MLFVLKKSQRYNVYVTLQNIFYAFLVVCAVALHSFAHETYLYIIKY